jgi:hypothetical protein
VGVVFSSPLKCTDFEYILSNSANTLIVYNENNVQYADKTSLTKGGGNGIMRAHRLDRAEWIGRDSTVHSGSLGVPTDAQSLDELKNMHASLDIIQKTIDANPQITHVFYSYDPAKDQMGLGIFARLDHARDNVVIITTRLREMTIGGNKLTEVILETQADYDSISKGFTKADGVIRVPNGVWN